MERSLGINATVLKLGKKNLQLLLLLLLLKNATLTIQREFIIIHTQNIFKLVLSVCLYVLTLDT